MDMTTLARLEHENMLAAMSLFCGQVSGSRVESRDGVTLIATGLPLRLFNQVLVEGDDAPAGAIGAAVAVTRGRGDRFVVNLRGGTDDRHLGAVEQLGLVPFPDNPWMPGMALHPLPPVGGTAVAAGHEIRPVTDAQGMEDHRRTAAAGFEMPLEWLETVMTQAVSENPAVAVYVGYTDGLPVTTGLGMRTGRTIGVYNISTVESARRKGYGAAMTARIVDDGAAAGCDVAILQASEMGYPIYERLGFRTVVEYMGYVEAEEP